MEVPILMPQLGESIAEATIVRLNIAVGDTVQADQEVIEVETNKATMGVTTLCGGTVSQIVAEEGQTYPVGSTLGLLEVSEEEAARTGVSLVASSPPETSAESDQAAPMFEEVGEAAPLDEAKAPSKESENTSDPDN